MITSHENHGYTSLCMPESQLNHDSKRAAENIQWLHDHDGPEDRDGLTHLPLDKMAAISADDIFKWIFLNENDEIPIQISLKFVPKGPIYNKPTLFQVMAWRRTGDKPLPEPMMAQLTEAYMWH